MSSPTTASIGPAISASHSRLYALDEALFDESKGIHKVRLAGAVRSHKDTEWSKRCLETLTE
jgi:hypothetical protein